jgi:hypothetical protein
MKAKEVNKIADSMNIEDECDVCGEKFDSKGDYTCNCYSPCCGERVIEDTDLCSGCHEHCRT